MAYAMMLQEDESITEFWCNVILDTEEYTSDFLCTKASGEQMVRECVSRSHLTKPMTVKMLDISREYWLGQGVSDWGLIIDAENDLIRTEHSVYRILVIDGGRVLAIDCLKRNMPKWYPTENLNGKAITEQELADLSDVEIFDADDLDTATRKTVHDRYTIIAGVLPFLADEKMRSTVISRVAEEHEICKQTVRNYLCLYLAFQNLSALAPKRIEEERPLSRDEKNMRWALNKFFYTKNQNSLSTAYTMMLKEKYSNETGTLLPDFPTFNQFRYFYRKHKKLQT